MVKLLLGACCLQPNKLGWMVVELGVMLVNYWTEGPKFVVEAMKNFQHAGQSLLKSCERSSQSSKFPYLCSIPIWVFGLEYCCRIGLAIATGLVCVRNLGNFSSCMKSILTSQIYCVALVLFLVRNDILFDDRYSTVKNLRLLNISKVTVPLKWLWSRKSCSSFLSSKIEIGIEPCNLLDERAKKVN